MGSFPGKKNGGKMVNEWWMNGKWWKFSRKFGEWMVNEWWMNGEWMENEWKIGEVSLENLVNGEVMNGWYMVNMMMKNGSFHKW